jgi:selenocysteine lyase/cysteine desulfurase
MTDKWPVPLDLTTAFSRFRAAGGDRLHFAAHSHHFWPDVSRDAHLQVWDDAARLADGKWDVILGEVWRDLRADIARHLDLPNPETLVPGPNIFSFVNRLLSCGPASRPMRVVTTDAEFHSFRRQTERLAEDGLIELDMVAAEPFATMADRIVAAVEARKPDMVFVSQVMFNSGFALTDLEGFVNRVSAPSRLIVIDGYHGFLARPTSLRGIADKAFYLAGGYKYAMSGEGACFMHCPPGFASRPRNTGWFASFGNLSGVQHGVPYAEDGWRFMGATFDASGLYRMRAVMDWLASEHIDAAIIHAHAIALQQRFIAAMIARPIGLFTPDNLVVPLSNPARGNFLTFEHARAADWYERLQAAGIVTDVRGNRLRVGFGIYQSTADVDTLIGRLRAMVDERSTKRPGC